MAKTTRSQAEANRVEGKKNQNVTHDSEAKYRSLFDYSPYGILIADEQSYYRDANKSMCQMLGYTHEELVGKHATDIVIPVEYPHIDSALEKIISRSEYQREWIFKRKDGSTFIGDVMVTVMPDDLLMAIVIDITERKQIENERDELNKKLEERVKERTAQLEETNRDLEAFTYSVSHDLRAPLRYINGYVDLLMKKYMDSLPDKARHYLEAIAASSTNLGKLTDDLLEFSHTGRKAMKSEEVDLEELIQQSIELLEPETSDRDITWEISDLPKVYGDHSLLGLAMLNLLGNALKFTQNKPKTIIQVGWKTFNSETCMFVSDNGIGFDMKYASKLFGVFQRLHAKDDFEGTGIGLANVHKIISRHEGRIWAESKPGKGATFYFTLPIKED